MNMATQAPATANSPAYEDLCLYIDGEFIAADARRTSEVLNPATGDVIAHLPHATRDDLDRALAAAARAFESWKKSSPMERSRILRRVAELTRERAQSIGRNITLDMGKPLAEAVGEECNTCDALIGEIVDILQSIPDLLYGFKAIAHKSLNLVGGTRNEGIGTSFPVA